MNYFNIAWHHERIATKRKRISKKSTCRALWGISNSLDQGIFSLRHELHRMQLINICMIRNIEGVSYELTEGTIEGCG